MTRAYNTAQRRLIDGVLSRGGDYSCEDLVKYLRENGTPVSIPTVYRHLSKLVEAGRLRTFYVDGKTRFKSIDPDEELAQLRCVRCGKSEPLDCRDLSSFKTHLAEHHRFCLDTSSLVLFGTCGRCSRKATGDTPSLPNESNDKGVRS